MSENSFGALSALEVGGRGYDYFCLRRAEAAGLDGVGRLPVSLKILLENLLRHEDGGSVGRGDIEALAGWARRQGGGDDGGKSASGGGKGGKGGKSNSGGGGASEEIAYRPARVLMQDFTGVPAVADLAAMRDAVLAAGKSAALINPVSPVDLVIDHSVMVDKFASPAAFEDNVRLEMSRNAERYRFLRWGQLAFDNFRVVPPGTGICHQVNLEYLAQVVRAQDGRGDNPRPLAFPDTLVGTDSHTTMINGLGVLGWGVGGIEAEAAMLGQPISMLIPDVVGFELSGSLNEGITATDLVLTVVEMLRRKGVVGKFVEFYGDGLNQLPLADRATIANMAPEYGATCGFFPIDGETIDYLKLTGRPPETVALVEAYTKAQGMWREPGSTAAVYSDGLSLDLGAVVPSLAGPKRPQDRVAMAELKTVFDKVLKESPVGKTKAESRVPVPGADYDLGHGDVVIAAITSCTNTSNPAVMLGAGLLAQKAVARGLKVKPWVKTSLAPGSKVVTEYLEKAGLQQPLNELGFNLVGYGCTTCIGNSGPLPPPVSEAIKSGGLMVSSVLSGNRNFEGRVHQEVRANWLASPPLVVAYSIAGTTRIDLSREPMAVDAAGKEVYLKDLWPDNAEVAAAVGQVSAAMFERQYADVFSGPLAWQAIEVAASDAYGWEDESTYIKQPPFFNTAEGSDAAAEGSDDGTAVAANSAEVQGARILALLGDSVTTDHISPAGAIPADGPAGRYLQERGVAVADFNSFGSRRGNHEVMMRGTFANIRIRNEMLPGVEGGYTRHLPSGEQLSIFDAAMGYQREGVPLVVIAGKEYGTGSSRDWAAKGTRLLGVKAVIAESFERIHRSNLIGMGVLPLVFQQGEGRKSLQLSGEELIDIRLPAGVDKLSPRQEMRLTVQSDGKETQEVTVTSRLDTDNEIAYFRSGGILQYVLDKLIAEAPE